MTTRKAAKAAVSKIIKDHGFIEERIMLDIGERLPDHRRIVEEALLAKDKLLGHNVLTLAKNLYGSDTRFVFELLQNADDNHFSKARAKGTVPFFEFKVYTDRIVVECNEDGFTAENLMAICNVGRSTKVGAQGYIGAKGIGFKSVFIAASKVDIQSGNFTFSFKHEKGDSGMGMIMPLWNPDAEVLPVPLTRMTLHLHKESTPQMAARMRRQILDQLNDLRPTCLLFLKNIKQITVTTYDEDNNVQKITSFLANILGPNRCCLKVRKESGQRQQNYSYYYHTTTYMAKGVPESVNRESAINDSLSPPQTTAEIILAFPLDALSKPQIRHQDVFAFLPVRETAFKFIIQADFDTTANRQDLITQSARNEHLRNAVAGAFVQAVSEFCEDIDLAFEWPLYLPDSTDRLEHFWAPFRSHLQKVLKDIPCIHSRNGISLKKPSSLVRLPADAQDEDGEPLLDDEYIDPFVSDEYSTASLELLSQYGLSWMGPSIFLDLLKLDLGSPSSVMRQPNTSEAWHSNTATFLDRHFDNKRSSFRGLALLPIRRGWRKCFPQLNDPVYLPNVGSLTIPPSVDALVIKIKAASNPQRKALFKKLGVTEASPQDVHNAFLRSYKIKAESGYSSSPLSINNSKTDLTFLYMTYDSTILQSSLEDIFILNANRLGVLPRNEAIYLRDDNDLGPGKLLVSPDGSSRYEVNFVHNAYFDLPPQPPSEGHPTWKRWLVDVLGVRERLRIIDLGFGHSPSKEWLFVRQHHPKKALYLLQSVWPYEGPQIRSDINARLAISSEPANDLCACSIEGPFDLSQTWLPVPEIMGQVEAFMGSCRHFPFLDLGDLCTTATHVGKWTFLVDTFGVGVKADLPFLFAMLYWIKQRAIQSDQSPDSQTVLKVYIAIAGKYWGSQDGDRAHARVFIREHFQRNTAIYIEQLNGQSDHWVELDRCRWGGPVSMTTKTVLRQMIDRSALEEQKGPLKIFFQSILGVRDVSCKDLLDELDWLSGVSFEHDEDASFTSDDEHEDESNYDTALAVYGYLNVMKLLKSDKEMLRSTFAEKKLIYCQFDDGMQEKVARWYRAGDCLWTSTSEIRGKVTLNDQYEDLEQFFVDVIGVERLNVQMLLDQLASPLPDANVEEIRGMLFSLNGFIYAEATVRQDPSSILKAKVFPVSRAGQPAELVSADSDFAINDRESLRELFRNEVTLLDFNLEEVRRLRPLLKWTGLISRYLSASVKEVTTVSADDGHPITSVKRDLKRKAYGLLRISATYDSARLRLDAEAFYHTLRNLETVESGTISSVLRIHQNGKMFEVHQSDGILHISETGGRVRIYVPSNRAKQELCFSSVLPKELADWLMRHPQTQISSGVEDHAILALSALLSFDDTNVDELLDMHGIIPVKIPNLDEVADSAESAESADEDTAGKMTGQELVQRSAFDAQPMSLVTEPAVHLREQSESPTASDQGIASPTESSESRVPMPSGEYRFTFETTASSRLTAQWSSRVTPIFTEAPLADADPQYLAMLRRTVDAARRAKFPSKGAFDMSAMQAALTTGSQHTSYDGIDVVRGLQASSQLERNFKIGAAGELYVFELLSRLDPPLTRWSRENWQSTIRRFASIHQDYRDLQPWHGTETSDFTYQDTHSMLTNLLIDKGYLEASVSAGWGDSTPKYFLEVKTTTGPNHMPFFMSKNQHRMMQTKHQQGLQSEIYVVLRVYGLDGDGIGMSVYVDPEQLRLDGSLEFAAEGWSVVPRASSSR